jgi:hypothetical protein
LAFEAQYRYISRNKDKYREYAKTYYHRAKQDPEKVARREANRKEWYTQNKESVLAKQREKKRHRKLEAIKYLGGVCSDCHGTFHPSIYEFHHRDPSEKDRDPSKLLQLKWERIVAELDKCDLLCANCHRLRHHNWELNDV